MNMIIIKSSNLTKQVLLLTLGSILCANLSFAQILPREGQETGLEELYDKFEDEEKTVVQKRREREQQRVEKKEAKELSTLSELGDLSPFENIAVIQRRFLPKTKRIELSAGGLYVTNNAFYNNLGLSLQAGFHLTDKFAIEGTYNFMTSDEKPITEGLVKNQNISTRALVQPESYMGAALKWSPIYGKMAWFQQKIIPYDIYFTPGFGMTKTVVGGSEATLSLGIGQLFALSKRHAVRWDFTWNSYQAEVEIDNEKKTKNHSDLTLAVGISFFFPEATYR